MNNKQYNMHTNKLAHILTYTLTCSLHYCTLHVRIYMHMYAQCSFVYNTQFSTYTCTMQLSFLSLIFPLLPVCYTHLTMYSTYMYLLTRSTESADLAHVNLFLGILRSNSAQRRGQDRNIHTQTTMCTTAKFSCWWYN